MLQVYRPAQPVQWEWITLKGPDAADFLHRLSTVHVKAVQRGEGSAGFILTAQGKVRAYFHLWKVSADEFFFELDAGASGKWKNDLLDVIEQFHFGEKFSVEKGEEPKLASAWILGELSGTSPKHLTETPDGLKLCHHGQADFGKPWVSVWGQASVLETWLRSLAAQPISFEELEALRISATRPRIDMELTENTIPLEVGLRDAISENKGCYPGQEVIERIVSIGSPAKRLARIEGTGTAPGIGDVVLQRDSSENMGIITSVVGVAGGFQALALVKKAFAQENLEVSFPSQPASRGKLVVIAPYA